MAQYPNDIRYTREHEWARQEGDVVKVGITSYAVEQLGDVTLVDLPAPGTDLRAEEHFGDIESVKAVSELFAPLSGEIADVNEELEASPELINESPYEQGWIVSIRPSDPNEFEALLNAAQYEDYLGSIDG